MPVLGEGGSSGVWEWVTGATGLPHSWSLAASWAGWPVGARAYSVGLLDA